MTYLQVIDSRNKIRFLLSVPKERKT